MVVEAKAALLVFSQLCAVAASARRDARLVLTAPSAVRDVAKFDDDENNPELEEIGILIDGQSV